jgi:hypothetical protein
MSALHAFHARKDYFTPSQRIALLTSIRPTRLNADGLLSFTLHTITGLHRLSINHYYGLICHLTPAQALSHLLNLCFQPKKPLESMPGFLGYYTGPG